MKRVALLLSLSTTYLAYTQDLESVKEQLEEIERQNLELRSQVMPTIKQYGFDSPHMDSLNSKILQFDSASLAFVTSLIDSYGWLGKHQVGEIANGAIFLTIQHAPNNNTRKKYFPLLKESAGIGDSELWAMATMQDRILVQDGELQIYGTQSHMVDGKLELYPMIEPEKVNKRRKKVGLSKLKRP